jgi:hypothetical protein
MQNTLIQLATRAVVGRIRSSLCEMINFDSIGDP